MFLQFLYHIFNPFFFLLRLIEKKCVNSYRPHPRFGKLILAFSLKKKPYIKKN